MCTEISEREPAREARRICGYDTRSFFKRAQGLKATMARYPMRSSWRAYRPDAQAAAAPAVARMSPARFRAHPRARSGFAAHRLRRHRLRGRHAAPSSRRAASPPPADRSPIGCASFTRRVAELIAQHSPAGDRRRTRVPLQERRQRAQARPGARRRARRRARGARRARIRAARHQARGGRRGRRGESPGRAHGQTTAARSNCKLAADAADALAVAICHAHSRRLEHSISRDRIRTRQTRRSRRRRI